MPLRKIYIKVLCITYIKGKERRTAAEERRAATEEKKTEVEERNVVMEERIKSIEQEQKFMFMDTSGLGDKAKAYVELCRDQVLAVRSIGGFMMGGFMGGMRGAMGAMGRGMGGAMDGNEKQWCQTANDVNGGIGEEAINGEEASHEEDASTTNGNEGNAI